VPRPSGSGRHVGGINSLFRATLTSTEYFAICEGFSAKWGAFSGRFR
jgi:hypothetical protein